MLSGARSHAGPMADGGARCKCIQLPVLATNGVRYATPYDKEILDVFTTIRYHTELDKAGRLPALDDRRHLRTAKEMNALFVTCPMPRRTR